ncbi:MAG: S1C family serine protease, partial [Clostridia bacterium]|nr:S1C family serine protease [Clostridia bacterium]
ELKEINPDIKKIELASDYYVGETAIAIGNPENEGMSVTKGIVSVDNEYITLSIDDTKRAYRSIRMDTALYGGNSGGGLFNAKGELIGICNAGDSEDQNINYAIPLDIVTGTVENILYYFGAEGFENGVHIITLGVTVIAENSRYVYDAALGYGKIKENVVLSSVTANSIAERLGLASGDLIKSLSINGKEWQIYRTFAISDLILTMRPGDSISFKYERGGVEKNTDVYVLQSRTDFKKI